MATVYDFFGLLLACMQYTVRENQLQLEAGAGGRLLCEKFMIALGHEKIAPLCILCSYESLCLMF